MEEYKLVRISKFLSRILRHDPQKLGLALEPGGWVSVEALLQGCQRAGFALTRAELDEVVATNDKQRYAYDSTGTKIRANQGHSVAVEMDFEQVAPPDELFHGTGAQKVSRILEQGLLKMQRHHVHLSPNVETAIKVGARHGRPVVFRVDAKRMVQDGHTFYRSSNGIWLVEHVPAQYLSLLS